MEYGIWTLLPIVVVVGLALATKRTLEPLLAGSVVAYIIISGWDFPTQWANAFFLVASDRDSQWVFMVCALFGSLIALLGASHGTLGFSKWLGKLCRGPKSTLLVTWIMGILIFVDDYLNIMTLSTSMQRLSDHHQIPREALSYIIDSTGAPVCALLPFSTWAVFFAGLFYAEPGVAELGYGSAIETFNHIIPFVFYAIFAVIMVPLFCFGIVPKMGYMRRAYARVQATGIPYSPESKDLNLEDGEEDPASLIQANIMDFVLPIAVLIWLAVSGGEIFLAVLGAIVTCFVLYVPRKKMSMVQFCDLVMHGFCNLVPTVAVIFFAFVMQHAMMDIDIANYVISAIRPFMSAPVFPVITFLMVAALNFSTGSVWGHSCNRFTDYYAAVFLHRCESAADHGRNHFRCDSGQPRLLLLQCHSVDLQLLQDAEHGPRPVSAALRHAHRAAQRRGVSHLRFYHVRRNLYASGSRGYHKNRRGCHCECRIHGSQAL